MSLVLSRVATLANCAHELAERFGGEDVLDCPVCGACSLDGGKWLTPVGVTRLVDAIRSLEKLTGSAEDKCPLCPHPIDRHVFAGCTENGCACIAAGVGLRLGRDFL